MVSNGIAVVGRGTEEEDAIVVVDNIYYKLNPSSWIQLLGGVK